MIDYLDRVKKAANGAPSLSFSSYDWRKAVEDVDVDTSALCSMATCDFFEKEIAEARQTEQKLEETEVSQWREKIGGLIKKLQLLATLTRHRLNDWTLNEQHDVVWHKMYEERIDKCVTLSESYRIPYAWWDKLFVMLPARFNLVNWWNGSQPLLTRLARPYEDAPQQLVSWCEVQKALLLLQWAHSSS